MKTREEPIFELEELKKVEQEKTAILNSLSEEITHLDMGMRVLWVNKAASESAGLLPEQLVGSYCYDVWCQNGEPRIDCPAERTIRTGQREVGEISTPDGRIFLHRSYPVRDEKENMVGIVMITSEITERKQAEKALRENEEAYRTLAENLPGMVYRVFIRENNRMQFFNNMLEVMTGFSAEELYAGEVCSIEPFILTEDREQVVSEVTRALLNKEPFEIEYRFKQKAGDIRHFLERGRPTYGADGKPLYIEGVIFDIGKRKMAEERLRKSEQEKAVILNATLEAMGTVDTSLRIVWANKVCVERAGFPPEQMAGRFCYEMWAQRSEPCVNCPILKVIETGRSEEAEIPSPDGKIWLHRGFPIRNASGQIERVVATAIDIHERKRYEEKLREHAQILDQIHDSVIATDLDGNVVTWNKGAERIFGYSAAEGLGQHISFVYPSDQHGFLQHEVIEPLKKKGRHEIEVKMRRKSGEDFYAHLSLSMLRNQKGSVIGMIGSSVDLTERKQIEEELRRSRKELEIRVRERTGELFEAIQDLQKTTELLERLFSNINSMIAYMDKDFNFLRVNSAWGEDDGRAPEFFIGKNLFDLFPNEDKRDFIKVVETGEFNSGYEKPFVHPEHPERGITYWDWHLQPLKESDGSIGGVVFSLVNVTERKRAEDALKESAEQLRHLSSQLMTVQEDERRQVARELHDGLGQSLTAIKFKIETFLQRTDRGKRKTKTEPLESAVLMLQDCVREIHRIRTDLRPSVLDLGILATVSWLCREFEGTFPAIRIEKRLDIREEEVQDSLKTAIYRISQEALNNISKHSLANVVHLSLRKIDRTVELSVKDNGRGFDLHEAHSTNESTRGIGLSSMRERAEHLGGSFSIQTSKGKGTLIRASWPLSSE
jgi:PAS domain S-box-containing protein